MVGMGVICRRVKLAGVLGFLLAMAMTGTALADYRSEAIAKAGDPTTNSNVSIHRLMVLDGRGATLATTYNPDTGSLWIHIQRDGEGWNSREIPGTGRAAGTMAVAHDDELTTFVVNFQQAGGLRAMLVTVRAGQPGVEVKWQEQLGTGTQRGFLQSVKVRGAARQTLVTVDDRERRKVRVFRATDAGLQPAGERDYEADTPAVTHEKSLVGTDGASYRARNTSDGHIEIQRTDPSGEKQSKRVVQTPKLGFEFGLDPYNGQHLIYAGDNRDLWYSYTGPWSTAGWTPSPATPQPPEPSSVDPPSPYSFQMGFKALADQIPDTVGQPLESEHYGSNGDSLQRTTGGLMVWRKADNWTAFTNGATTWINGPNGLQSRPNAQRFEWEPDYDPSTGMAAQSVVVVPLASPQQQTADGPPSVQVKLESGTDPGWGNWFALAAAGDGRVRVFYTRGETIQVVELNKGAIVKRATVAEADASWLRVSWPDHEGDSHIVYCDARDGTVRHAWGSP